MQLQAVVDDLALQIGDPVLGHRSGDGVERSGDKTFYAVIDENTGHGRLGFGLGQRELGVLELKDAFAEGLAFLRVANRDVERAFDHRNALHRHQQPLLRQFGHQLGEALAFLGAEQAVGGHTHFVEEQLGGVVALQANLVEIAATAEAFHLVGLDHEERGALGACGWIGLGDNDDQVGVLAIGDEGLLAVDDVAVAVALGRGAHALQVGAGAGLGHSDRAYQFAGGEFRQPAAFLFLGAEMQDVGGDDRRMQRDAETVETGQTQRVGDHRLMGEGAAGTAIFLRHGGAEQTRLAGLLPVGALDHTGLFPVVSLSGEFGFKEFQRGIGKDRVILVHPVRAGQIDGRHVLFPLLLRTLPRAAPSWCRRPSRCGAHARRSRAGCAA